MMRKHSGRKHATHRKGARVRAKSRVRRSGGAAPAAETGFYDPNRGEATS
jgi:hypothetical protein